MAAWFVLFPGLPLGGDRTQALGLESQTLQHSLLQHFVCLVVVIQEFDIRLGILVTGLCDNDDMYWVGGQSE